MLIYTANYIHFYAACLVAISYESRIIQNRKVDIL